jgi:hypothetical protein
MKGWRHADINGRRDGGMQAQINEGMEARRHERMKG